MSATVCLFVCVCMGTYVFSHLSMRECVSEYVCAYTHQRLTFRFRNFSVSKLLPNLWGFRFRKIWFRKKSLGFGFEKIWSRKKVSVSVSENLVSEKKSRFRFRKNLVSEKSLCFGFGKFGLVKKVSVSVSVKILVSSFSGANNFHFHLFVLACWRSRGIYSVHIGLEVCTLCDPSTLILLVCTQKRSKM